MKLPAFLQALFSGSRDTRMKDLREQLDKIQKSSRTRPMLRNEDLERLRATHNVLTSEIEETRQVAGKIVDDLNNKLLETTRRLDVLTSMMMDALITLDHEGKILNVNPAAEMLFDKRAVHMVGTNVNEYLEFSPNDGLASRLHVEASKFLEYISKLKIDDRMDFKQARRVYTEYSSRPSNSLNKVRNLRFKSLNKILDIEAVVNIVNPDAECEQEYAYTVVMRDVTARNESIAKINDLTQFQLSLLASVPNPIYYRDSNGRILGVNTAFETTFNLRGHHIIGKTLYEVFGVDAASKLQPIDDEILNIDKADVCIHHADVDINGVAINTVVYGSALRDSLGDLRGSICVVVDMTEMEQTLKSSSSHKLHLLSLIESSSDIITFETLEGKILLENKNATVFFETQGQLQREFTVRQRQLTATLRETKDSISTNITLYDEEGMSHSFDVVKMLIPTDDGLNVLSVSKEVTHLIAPLIQSRLLGGALNCLDFPVCIIDNRSKFVFANSAFVSHFDLDPGILIDTPVTKVIQHLNLTHGWSGEVLVNANVNKVAKCSSLENDFGSQSYTVVELK